MARAPALHVRLHNPGGTGKFVEYRYDHEGRKTFESYAQRLPTPIDSALPGRVWVYDGLDREVLMAQDSELGVLNTITAYQPGFQKHVTNPRGFATTYSYQAFDQPSMDHIAGIAAPESTSITIARDLYGNPTAITRGGTSAYGTQQATRSYVYDTYKRLCKTIEPETGATVQAYDAAGNVAWRASGQALPGTSTCDQASVPLSTMVSFGYDARDHLTSTTFGDGAPGIKRSYTPDGQLYETSSDGSVWTYGYNNRRLLTSETLYFGGTYRSLVHGINPHGHRATLTDPDGTLDYAPNALGQPTQVSGYASGVSFHPNGQLAGYTAAKRVAVDITQNTRGLPWSWMHGNAVRDVYTYDANGNVAAIIDTLNSAASRSMGYDGLDRLTAANGIWGAGAYGYDTLDNLRASVVGGRTAVADFDSGNRLARLTVNGAPIGFGYDANGNVRSRGAQGYVFDIGNRLRSATGIASYAYDGHGRRTWLNFNNTRTRVQMYSQAGKLMYSVDSANGTTRHVYLGDKLIAEHSSTAGPSWVHTDVLGSPVTRTDGSGAVIPNLDTRYEPYGAAVAGTANPDGIGFTGHVNDPATGLVYMQQRYYDPYAGRFLSVDPVTTNAKDGSFFGRYHYANNNPYKFKDPDGRAPGSFDCDCSGGGSGLPVSPIVTLQIIAIQNGASPAAVQAVTAMAAAAVTRGGAGKNNAPKSDLPRGKGGEYLPHPQAEGAHSTIGTRTGSDGNTYRQGATFDEKGNFRGRTDVTDHGSPQRPGHTNPHHHPATGPASTGPATPGPLPPPPPPPPPPPRQTAN